MAYQPEKYIRKDGTIVYVANQSMGGNKLTNVGNAIAGTDLINLSQLIDAMSNVIAVTNVFTTGESIAKHKLVYVNSDGKIYKANSSLIPQMHKVIGISKNEAEADTAITVCMFGLQDGFTGLSVGVPYFFDTNGNLSIDAPNVGYTQCVGVAIDSTKFYVNLQVPIGI